VDASVVTFALDPNKPITMDQSVLRLGQHAEPQREGHRPPTNQGGPRSPAGGLLRPGRGHPEDRSTPRPPTKGSTARTESKVLLRRRLMGERVRADVLTSARACAQIGALKGRSAPRDTLIRATNALAPAERTYRTPHGSRAATAPTVADIADN
jgi:hypothetical protein